jgi:hypothetical protein
LNELQQRAHVRLSAGALRLLVVRRHHAPSAQDPLQFAPHQKGAAAGLALDVQAQAAQVAQLGGRLLQAIAQRGQLGVG